MSIEAMKQWLEALEINLVFLRNVKPFKGQEDLASDCVAMTEETITSLRQAIADAEKQEPIGYLEIEDIEDQREYPHNCRAANLWYEGGEGLVAVYTHPQPKREWVGLTDEEVEDCYKQGGIGRAIQMLKEKNT